MSSNKIALIPVGTRYGKLTVLEDLGMVKSEANLFHHKLRVKCDCGNELEVGLKSIKRGMTNCRRCAQNELVGKRFGKLEIIEKGLYKDGRLYFKCKCDCGNTKIMKWKDLQSGDSTSCGECSRYDLVGKRIGHLFVKSFNHYDRDKGLNYYKCLCDCGVESIVSREKLLDGIKTGNCTCGECYNGLPNSYEPETKEKCLTLARMWQGLNQKCINPNNRDFFKFGGRGIKMDITSDEFVRTFYRDKAYNESTWVDRIDDNDDYRFGNLKLNDNIENTNSYPEMSYDGIASRLMSAKIFSGVINKNNYNRTEFTKIKTNQVNKVDSELFLYIHNSLLFHKHFYINRIKKFYEDCGGSITFTEE